MSDTTITLGEVSIAVTGVDEPGAVHGSRFPTQLAQIEDVFHLMPAQHLRHVPTIAVGDRPARGGGYFSSPPRIGLNRGVFSADYNQHHLFTLLHECGHAVDRGTHAVARFASQCGGNLRDGAPGNADWESYRAIRYRGRNKRPDGTPQFGEHFAEGYAILLTRPARLNASQQRIIRRMAGM